MRPQGFRARACGRCRGHEQEAQHRLERTLPSAVSNSQRTSIGRSPSFRSGYRILEAGPGRIPFLFALEWLGQIRCLPPPHSDRAPHSRGNHGPLRVPSDPIGWVVRSKDSVREHRSRESHQLGARLHLLLHAREDAPECTRSLPSTLEQARFAACLARNTTRFGTGDLATADPPF